ncbi:hypothetical protein [Streptomyces sp. NPDC053427]|uniref:hypothetical protein n=1 Tax=Streptomyces sp. NPDC053427 TaxID=3365701 RepID=UPI0037D12686
MTTTSVRPTSVLDIEQIPVPPLHRSTHPRAVEPSQKHRITRRGIPYGSLTTPRRLAAHPPLQKKG